MAEKLAIDFGTAFTNIYKLGCGMVLSEPTVAAVATDGKNSVKAIGAEAKKLIGKTAENTKIIFPIFEGEVVNERIATKILAYFLQKIGLKTRLSGCVAVMSVPCGATAELIKKFELVALNAGVAKVAFVEAPLLSAIGQRIPLTESSPCFVIDMGGGTTNIAALSLDGIIAGVSVNFGGNKIDTDLIDFIAENYNLQIGLLTAERLKIQIGSLLSNDALSAVVNGRDVELGTPRSISIKALDILQPVRTYFDKIAEIAVAVLAKLPPEVSAEIRHAGLYVSGATAGIYGLEQYYKEKFGMQINVAEEPKMSIAFGGGVVLGSEELLKKVRVKNY